MEALKERTFGSADPIALDSYVMFIAILSSRDIVCGYSFQFQSPDNFCVNIPVL